MSKWASRILVISGLIQSGVIKTHINFIISLYSQIIGFYMFAFVLFTIVNILNGVNFSSKKSLVPLVSTYVTSAIQIMFGWLYVSTVLSEVNQYAEIAFDKSASMSTGFIGLSVVMTLVAMVLASVHYFKKTEIIEDYL